MYFISFFAPFILHPSPPITPTPRTRIMEFFKPPSSSSSSSRDLRDISPLTFTDEEIYGDRAYGKWGTEIRRREGAFPKPAIDFNSVLHPKRARIIQQQIKQSAGLPLDFEMCARDEERYDLDELKLHVGGDEGRSVLYKRANGRLKGVQIFRPFGAYDLNFHCLSWLFRRFTYSRTESRVKALC